jgi:hypothetical protein
MVNKRVTMHLRKSLVQLFKAPLGAFLLSVDSIRAANYGIERLVDKMQGTRKR